MHSHMVLWEPSGFGFIEYFNEFIILCGNFHVGLRFSALYGGGCNVYESNGLSTMCDGGSSNGSSNQSLDWGTLACEHDGHCATWC